MPDNPSSELRSFNPNEMTGIKRIYLPEIDAKCDGRSKHNKCERRTASLLSRFLKIERHKIKTFDS
jgi:hypothetical protein